MASEGAKAAEAVDQNRLFELHTEQRGSSEGLSTNTHVFLLRMTSGAQLTRAQGHSSSGGGEQKRVVVGTTEQRRKGRKKWEDGLRPDSQAS